MPITTITFGGITLNVSELVPVKVPGTIKQIVGRQLIQHNLPGRAVQDWSITISGEFFEGTRDTLRTDLENLDDLNVYAYVDGIHDGQYILVPGTLQFTDSGVEPNRYLYTLQIIQYNQT